MKKDLRSLVRESGISLGELSSTINYSKTTLSLWMRGRYPNAHALEEAIARWAGTLGLTPRDRRKCGYISDLLDHAENKDAIIDAILRGARKTEASRLSP